MPVMKRTISALFAISVLVAGCFADGAVAQSDPLPSWNDGGPKKSITDFVAKVTTQGGPDFVRRHEAGLEEGVWVEP